jgi:hypothetical protein
MSTESDRIDPYAIVLADLRAKRDQIDQAIQAIESVRGAGSPVQAPLPSNVPPEGSAHDAGVFLGLSIAEATKKLLSMRKQAMNNADIATALQKGGVVMNSNTDPQNIVGSVLTRRFDKIGDIVRVGRGIWGLKEWYPNRSFKPTTRVGEAEEQAKAATTVANEPQPPSDQTVEDLM